MLYLIFTKLDKLLRVKIVFENAVDARKTVEINDNSVKLKRLKAILLKLCIISRTSSYTGIMCAYPCFLGVHNRQ